MTVIMIVAINILLNIESIVSKSVSPFVNMNLFASQHENINRSVIIASGVTVVSSGVMKDGTVMNNGVKKRINEN